MNFLKKWYTYQKERFPVAIYSMYIFAIVFATYAFVGSNSGVDHFDVGKIVLMFIVTILQFFMVRIVDEFKDYEEDCMYRPYRPVPRGLITLKELKYAFIISLAIQIIITFFVCKHAFPFLIALWIVFGLMTKGFFIKKFLDKHILVEVLFDELMLPFILLYITNFVNPTVNMISVNYYWAFLLLGYLVSWIVEIARKVRCKEDEEKGVKTYTAVFGIPKATIIMITLEVVLFAVQMFILNSSLDKVKEIIFGTIFTIILLIDVVFMRKKSKTWAKLTELSANIFILIAYLSMGILML